MKHLANGTGEGSAISATSGALAKIRQAGRACENRPGLFALSLAFVYLSAAAFVTSHHEMWRDELQAWMIARESADLAGLFDNLRYEGHPPLWHLLLFALTRITHDPGAMKVLHLSIATMAVMVMAWRAPFSILEKVLLAFSYFLFFEYAAISRNYGIGVLLIFLACTFFPLRHSRPWPLAACLGLLAWTSILAAIVSIVMVAALLGEALWTRRYRGGSARAEHAAVFPALALAALAIAASVALTIPPADSGFAEGWRPVLHMGALAAGNDRLVAAYLPLPPWSESFWNGNVLLAQEPWRSVARVIVPVTAMIHVIALLRRPVALVIYVGATVGLLLFFEAKYPGFLRHHGYLFVVLVMSEWLRRAGDPAPLPIALNKVVMRCEAALRWTFPALLAVQLVAGAKAAALEVRHVFSNAEIASKYLQQSGLAERHISGIVDYAASAVAGFLPAVRVFYPQGERSGTFIVWDRKRTELAPDTFAQHGAQHMSRQPSGAILLLNFALDPPQADRHGLALRAQFTGAVVGDENFYIYEKR